MLCDGGLGLMMTARHCLVHSACMLLLISSFSTDLIIVETIGNMSHIIGDRVIGVILYAIIHTISHSMFHAFPD